MQTTARFPIYQAWTPEPTPKQYINYFGNGSMKPDVVTVKVVEFKTEYKDRWHTATPTPPITDALGDQVPYPYENGEVIASWMWWISALVLLCGIVMLRGEKV